MPDVIIGGHRKGPLVTPSRIRLVHWKPQEAKQRVEHLRRHGFLVDASSFRGPGDLERLRRNPPHAVLIDLSRLPSQGRDIGLALRGFKVTRAVPLVFVGGDPAKVERIRSLLPDATYTDWSLIVSATRKAMANPLPSPVAPDQMAGYAGAPLVKKLGIRPDTIVRLIREPDGFRQALGPLPHGAHFLADKEGAGSLCIWFVRTPAELQQQIAAVAADLVHGSVWIVWPKKGSKLESGLSQPLVRAAGLHAGLVDYKICSVDETWSGLLFTRRRPKTAR